MSPGPLPLTSPAYLITLLKNHRQLWVGMEGIDGETLGEDLVMPPSQGGLTTPLLLELAGTMLFCLFRYHGYKAKVHT